MFIKVLALAGGLAGAAGLSQFPEYSQQYMQRLSGAVDELSHVVARFDADAESLGLSRDTAMEDLRQGGKMAQAQALSMGYVLERYDRLTNDLEVLKGSAMADKVLNFWRFTDSGVARQALSDFQPAVPLTPQGLGLAAVGYLTGYGVLSILLGGLARLFRRRRAEGHPA
ncbi:hypothetical protein PEL8287_03538 [Roseovarius litorisediminis]|uniref:DUF2937 domain-containing protein n=1 Tax=Roseovarius litorisediminis TaxID=1312363 RepID=A0A1Y5TKS4_9RHOB|nr:DUF2937 family protein [Roseovarius litorisediminis]SLN64330.1 hypothetical protein PEL8287_03538 [Roseovarius litorisediminis]